MKFLLFLISCVTFATTNVFTQITIKHPHCHCEDFITQMEPNLNGDFQRKCNGKVVIQGQFNNGIKNGQWITWSKNGNVIRKFTYNNGVIDGKIELYYSSGAKKVVGEFINGRQDGNWTYYNKTGKIIKIGSFMNGVPIGVWKIYNFDGKKELVVYDFDTAKYILNKSKESLFEPDAVFQNDNSSEWWIRHVHNSGYTEANSKPFEGYRLISDMNVLLMEIPLEIWETYTSYSLQASLKFNGKSLVDVDIQFIEGHAENCPEIGFFATTNEAAKLTNVEHPNLTKILLSYNIEEAVWLMGPWITNEQEVKLYLPYVINEFKNSPFK